MRKEVRFFESMGSAIQVTVFKSGDVAPKNLGLIADAAPEVQRALGVLKDDDEKSLDGSRPRDTLGLTICNLYSTGVLLKRIAEAINTDSQWGGGWNEDRISKEITRYCKKHPEMQIFRRNQSRNRQD